MAGSSLSGVNDARRECVALKQSLDALVADYQGALREMPINFQGEVHKYMCVRLAGFLEQTFYLAIVGYIRQTSSEKSASFALSFFRAAPNLKPGALEKLIDRFASEWTTELAALLDSGNRRDQLGTLLRIRNDTAHGVNYRGTSPQVTTYYGLATDLYAWCLRTLLKT